MQNRRKMLNPPLFVLDLFQHGMKAVLKSVRLKELIHRRRSARFVHLWFLSNDHGKSSGSDPTGLKKADTAGLQFPIDDSLFLASINVWTHGPITIDSWRFATFLPYLRRHSDVGLRRGVTWRHFARR